MSWHHPDLYFFLCLAASLSAFLAPSIIDDELLARRRKPPVVEPRRSTVNEKAVDPPSPPQYVDPLSPPKYLKNVRPLDGLQRDRQGGAADAQSAREFRTVFNMTSQARKEAMIEKWMRRQGCSRSRGGGVAAR
jgi:hypothetical protein